MNNSVKAIRVIFCAILAVFSILIAKTAAAKSDYLTLNDGSGAKVSASRISVQFDTMENAKIAADKLGAKLVYYSHISALKRVFCGHFELSKKAASLNDLNKTIEKLRLEKGCISATYDQIIQLND